MTSMIVGLYHRNFADLKIHVRVTSNHKTIPLSEPLLLAIYNDPRLSEEHRLIIDLMAFAGERINALSMTEPKNVYLLEGTESALLDIEAHLNKTDTGHAMHNPKGTCRENPAKCPDAPIHDPLPELSKPVPAHNKSCKGQPFGKVHIALSTKEIPDNRGDNQCRRHEPKQMDDANGRHSHNRAHPLDLLSNGRS